jgi:hypothetical protein
VSAVCYFIFVFIFSNLSPPTPLYFFIILSKGDGFSCGDWNDTSAANAEYAAVRGFFDEKFPEYKSNDLYLIGERYTYKPLLFVDEISF